MMAPIPRWAQVTALVLGVFAVAVLIWGRGGTWVLIAALALFVALAIPLLSQPDEEPG